MKSRHHSPRALSTSTPAPKPYQHPTSPNHRIRSSSDPTPSSPQQDTTNLSFTSRRRSYDGTTPLITPSRRSSLDLATKGIKRAGSQVKILSRVHVVDSQVLDSLERVEGNGHCFFDDATHTKHPPFSTKHSGGGTTQPSSPREPDISALDPNVPTCLICLSKFTAKRVGIRIPCSGDCNPTALVHQRCIFDWKEQSSGMQPGSTGTCPLCRQALTEMEYDVPDPLMMRNFVMFSARRAFVSRPSPMVSMLRAYVRVVGTGSITRTPIRYEMWLQAPTSRPYPQGPLPPTNGTQHGDQLLLTARRFVSPNHMFGSRICVSLDRDGKDFASDSPNHVATIYGSPSGLDYTIKSRVKEEDSTTQPSVVVLDSPSPTAVSPPISAGFAAVEKRHRKPSKKRLELGSIHFDQNRIGSGAGPRRISVCLPKVREDPNAGDAWPPKHVVKTPAVPSAPEDEDDEDDDDYALDDPVAPDLPVFRIADHIPATKRDSLVFALKNVRKNQRMQERGRALPPSPEISRFIFAYNEEPYYVAALHAFSLDFSGRVTLPSNKNFLLKSDGGEGTMLVFGKIGVAGVSGADCDVYTLDFQWPLSPAQAFGIALASCDRKMACA